MNQRDLYIRHFPAFRNWRASPRRRWFCGLQLAACFLPLRCGEAFIGVGSKMSARGGLPLFGLLRGIRAVFCCRRSAKHAARRIPCANNLKQIGLAFHFYIRDYEDFLLLYGQERVRGDRTFAGPEWGIAGNKHIRIDWKTLLWGLSWDHNPKV